MGREDGKNGSRVRQISRRLSERLPVIIGIESLTICVLTGVLILLSAGSLGWVLDFSKRNKTIAIVKDVGSVLNKYYAANRNYPRQRLTKRVDRSPRASLLTSIKDQLEPTYVKELPVYDGWGRPLFYRNITIKYDKGKRTGGKKEKGAVEASAGRKERASLHWMGARQYSSLGACLSDQINLNCEHLRLLLGI